MKRFLSFTALCLLMCLLMVACSGSNSDSPNNNPTNDFKGDLDPNANALEFPPSNGQLPADLIPPA